MTDYNAREELENVAAWLGYHHEDLSFGLKSAEDGLKLFRAWQADPALPEFCDYDPTETVKETKARVARVKKALGYDPWVRCHELPSDAALVGEVRKRIAVQSTGGAD